MVTFVLAVGWPLRSSTVPDNVPLAASATSLMTAASLLEPSAAPDDVGLLTFSSTCCRFPVGCDPSAASVWVGSARPTLHKTASVRDKREGLIQFFPER